MAVITNAGTFPTTITDKNGKIYEIAASGTANIYNSLLDYKLVFSGLKNGWITIAGWVPSPDEVLQPWNDWTSVTTAALFTSTDPTLGLGQLGFESDTAKMKIGDGVTAWTSLSYAEANGTVASGIIAITGGTAAGVAVTTSTINSSVIGGVTPAAGTFTTVGGTVGSFTSLRVSEAANGKQGLAVLVGGTVVVANTSITANSRILLTTNVPGGTPGWLQVSARTPGTSFTILSSSGTDTSSVAYQIFEPAA